MTAGSTRIVLDDSLEDGKWIVTEDFKTKAKIISVAENIFDKVEAGLIPDEILEEMQKGSNGNSPI